MSPKGYEAARSAGFIMEILPSEVHSMSLQPS